MSNFSSLLIASFIYLFFFFELGLQWWILCRKGKQTHHKNQCQLNNEYMVTEVAYNKCIAVQNHFTPLSAYILTSS